MGAELLIGGIVGGISAGVSAAGAAAQNAAIQRSMNVNAQNARTRQQQMVERRRVLANQTMDQRRMAQLQAIRQANAVEGRARAAAAMSGRSTAQGSAARSLEVVNADRLFNQMVIDRNFQGQMMALNSQYSTGVSDNLSQFNALMAQLQSQSQDPFLNSIQGGLGGFGTGVSIANGLNLS